MTNICIDAINPLIPERTPPPKVALTQQDHYSNWLQAYDWTYFCTFTTQYCLTLKSARRMMHRYTDILKRETGCDVRLFWVCEKFELKDGFHLHALMKIDQPPHREGYIFSDDDKERFRVMIECYQIAAGSKKDRVTGKFDRFHRVEFKRFNPKQAGGRYCTKYVLKEQGKRIEADYDLFI